MGWGHQPPGGYGPPPGYPAQQGYGPQIQPTMGMTPHRFPMCNSCGHQGIMQYASKVSTGGWIVFVILLIGCFPLCFIPLLVAKSRAQQCPRCLNIHGQWS